MSREISEPQLPPLSSPEPVCHERSESPIELDDLECTVCTDQFSSDVNKQPRTLPCGHSICTSCIQRILETNDESGYSHCPICRNVFEASSAEDVPISFSLQNLATLIGSQYELRKKTPTAISVNSCGFCDLHHSPKQFWCLSCTVWICGVCSVVNHKESSASCCSVISIHEVIEVRKKFHEVEHMKLLDTKKVKLVALSKAGDVCNNSTESTTNLVTKLKESLKTENARIHNLQLVKNAIEENSSSINGEILTLETLSQKIKTSTVYSEFLKALKAYKNISSINSSERFFVQFPSGSWTRTLVLECFVENSQNIFAEEIINNKNQYFKVSYEGSNLRIHSANDRRCFPPGTVILQLSDILKEKCSSFFLDLSYSSDVEFKLCISLHTILSDHLSSFCSHALGRLGCGYVKKCFSTIEKDPIEDATIIWMGCNPGDTIAGSQGTNGTLGPYKHFEAGTIFVPRDAQLQNLCSIFGILLTSSLVKFSKRLTEIGIVENDLQIFRDILRSENIGQLQIKDCGCLLKL